MNEEFLVALRCAPYESRQSRRLWRARIARAVFTPRAVSAVAFTFCLIMVSSAVSSGIHALARQDALSLLAASDPAVEGSVDELIQTLARIKQYEQQLRLKSTQLDAAIFEAGELDDELVSEKIVDKKHAKALGVGGGDNPRAPIISLRGEKGLPQHRAELVEHIARQIDALRSIPVGYPVVGSVTSTFGYRTSPFGRRSDFHNGLDIAIDRETSVVAVADGVVVHAGYKGAYGNMVLIDHGNGYETAYAHLAKMTVKVGEKLCRGEKLGFVGTTGRSTGPHLHYEVRKNGKPINPSRFVQLAGLLNTF